MNPDSGFIPWTPAAWLRFAWAVASAFVVESLVFGLAVLPAALFWEWHIHWNVSPRWLHVMILAMSFLPAYLMFAIVLMVLSAAATRITGWRAVADAQLRISDLEWPLLDWVRYSISTHIVRVFAGTPHDAALDLVHALERCAARAPGLDQQPRRDRPLPAAVW